MSIKQVGSNGSDQSGPAERGAIARATNICVRYPNGGLGLHDVSVCCDAGQVVTLFGANGAGKTSTVRALSGFLKTEQTKVIRGQVTLLGEDVTNKEPHIQSKQGMFFIQERKNTFPNLTVGDNLTALRHPPKRALRAELIDRVFTLFPVLGERQKSRAGTLSGGQRQMLAIGRAIMAQPKILIIDELTLGLHHSLQEPLFKAVRNIADTGVAVFLVDESAGYALDIADYCYVLSAGRVYSEGTPDRFADRAEIVAGYVAG